MRYKRKSINNKCGRNKITRKKSLSFSYLSNDSFKQESLLLLVGHYIVSNISPQDTNFKRWNDSFTLLRAPDRCITRGSAVLPTMGLWMALASAAMSWEHSVLSRSSSQWIWCWSQQASPQDSTEWPACTLQWSRPRNAEEDLTTALDWGNWEEKDTKERPWLFFCYRDITGAAGDGKTNPFNYIMVS